MSKQLTLKISDPGSYTSQNKPVISPSASLRSRPQSFAQKLRSTGTVYNIECCQNILVLTEYQF